MKFRNKSEILENAASETLRKLRKDAMDILGAAVDSVDPHEAVKRSARREENKLLVGDTEFALDDFSRIFVIGGGKAGTAMAEAVEGLLGGRITGGVVNVLRGKEREGCLRNIRLNGASHPIPDEAGVRGVEEMLSILDEAREDDLIIVLISGGGSALMTHPAGNISLEEVRELTDLLLRSGATINELNAVRKHISDVKGGRMAKRAHPATVISLILSDVVGDPLDTIASGPTAPDPTTFGDAISVLKDRGLWERMPDPILHRLKEGATGKIEETPKPGDAVFDKVHNIIIGSNPTAARAAVKRASALGYNSMLLTTKLEGEASRVGTNMAEVVRKICATDGPVRRPAAVVAGGETTVTVVGKGRGGRNQELALSAALEIEGLDAVITTLATDGIDGPTDAAGAIVDGSTLRRAGAMGLKAADFLAENDSYSFFSKLGDALLTGPTGTNVNDLTLLLVSR
ncbi:MAG: glycerate kinase [Candidatus Bathyarchaeota archaeon]|jgi:glycerate-2-kinase|nr:glycerate kinase [Candidatus Bathyarchaeota archaeon]